MFIKNEAHFYEMQANVTFQARDIIQSNIHIKFHSSIFTLIDVEIGPGGDSDLFSIKINNMVCSSQQINIRTRFTSTVFCQSNNLISGELSFNLTKMTYNSCKEKVKIFL